MKTRKGFVSNSSSSSFLIGIGRVVNEEKLEAFLKQLDKWDYHIVPVSEIMVNQEQYGQYTTRRSQQPNTNNPKITAVVDSFMYDEVELDVTNMDPDDKVFMLYHTSGDDGDFWKENWGEYDYDIDLDFFDDRIVDGCGNPDEKGLADFTFTYGAGRNG